jgi:hypothetical protein
MGGCADYLEKTEISNYTAGDVASIQAQAISDGASCVSRFTIDSNSTCYNECQGLVTPDRTSCFSCLAQKECDQTGASSQPCCQFAKEAVTCTTCLINNGSSDDPAFALRKCINNKSRKPLIIGLVIGSVVIVIIGFVIGFTILRLQRRKDKLRQLSSDIRLLGGGISSAKQIIKLTPDISGKITDKVNIAFLKKELALKRANKTTPAIQNGVSIIPNNDIKL